MRHIMLLMVLMLSFTVGQFGNSAAGQASKHEEEVRKLERAWLDAYEQHDAKAMDAIVADDFTITFPDGSMQTKPQILEAIKAPRRPNAPTLKFYTEDVQSRVYSDIVVILIGRVVTEYVRDGKPVKEESRYTDTYVKRQGRWQVVASHLSNVPKPQAQHSPDTSNAGTGRSVHENTIVSPKLPPVRISVDEQLRHVGDLDFTLKKVAQVERYIFARADESGRVQRLFMAQFESILPGVKGGYSFKVENATRLGEHDYQTNVGFFNFAERIAQSPGAEAEHTKAFLDTKGLKVDDDFLVARYARITDAEKRQELILFYMENLRDMGFTRAELEPGGAHAAKAAKIFNDFALRATQSFKVADGKS